jgi:hypothetical protein
VREVRSDDGESDDLLSMLSPESAPAIDKALLQLGNPHVALTKLKRLVGELVDMLRARMQWVASDLAFGSGSGNLDLCHPTASTSTSGSTSGSTCGSDAPPVTPRARLIALFEEYNPAKLEKVDATLAKYAGRGP